MSAASRPSLLLRTEPFWTIEVPVRGGGWAIPVHGVDGDGFALDPHAEIPVQRERHQRCDEAIGRGDGMDQIVATISEVESKHSTRCSLCSLTYSEHVLRRGRDCGRFQLEATP